MPKTESSVIVPSRFDEDYIYFMELGQSSKKTAEQVALIIDLIRPSQSSRILDAPCGAGRISLQLARAGFDVIGLDGQPLYISEAEKKKALLNVHCQFVLGDLRTQRFHNEFCAVVSWFVSIGYFDRETDKQIIANYFDALDTGGTLLLDHIYLPGYEAKRKIEPDQIRTIKRDEGSMTISSQYDWNKKLHKVFRKVNRCGKASSTSYTIQLYSPMEITELLFNTGFSSVEVLPKWQKTLNETQVSCVFKAIK